MKIDIERNLEHRFTSSRAKWFLTSLNAALSQLPMALAIWLMRVLEPKSSDFLVVYVQVGISGLTGIVIGVTYGYAVGRSAFSHWRLCALLGSLFTVCNGIIVFCDGIFDSTSKMELQNVLALIFFTVGGSALSFSGTLRVSYACKGRPHKLTGVSMGSNFALVLGILLLKMLDSQLLLVGGSFAWMTISLISGYRSWKYLPVGNSVVNMNKVFKNSHLLALLGGAVTSSLLPALLTSTLTELSVGTTSGAFLILRIASSAVYLFSATKTIVRYNWGSDSKSEKSKWQIPLISCLFFVPTLFMAKDSPDSINVFTTVGMILLMHASIQALAAANANRLGSAIMYKVIIDFFVTIICLGTLKVAPSVEMYYLSNCLSSCFTVLVCSYGLRDKKAIFSSLLAAILLISNSTLFVLR